MDGMERIGSYLIEREVGRGGMGVVYLARDPRLGRNVAIKALPEHLADDPDRLGRFDREARALASLSHPNVAQIYGVEEDGARRYLVLEYVEGQTLEEVLDAGAMSVDDALDIAVQIARGVEAAHEAGVVHRDLKPGNVKITSKGEVKVLDFGLAKATEQSGASSGSIAMTESPTMTMQPAHRPTIPGAILGTASYMSPEQARGRAADPRTDIWSLGVILYEMLTGAGPFVGETATDVLGAILHVDPQWSRLPKGTPATIQLLLRRCLQRDRKRRLQSMGDARVELEAAIEDPTGTSLGLAGEVLAATGRRGVPFWLVLALVPLLLGVGAGAAWMLRERAHPAVMHVGIPFPERFQSIVDVDLSPDGRMLAIVASEKSAGERKAQNAVYVRDWSSIEFRKLPGSERAIGAIFSPKGSRVACVVPGELDTVGEVRLVPVDAGPALKVYEFTQRSLLASRGIGFATDDELLAPSRDGSELYRVAATGGAPALVGRFDSERGNSVVDGMPRPGGKFAVVTRWLVGGTPSLLRVDLETGEMSLVLEDARDAKFLDSGHIAFVRNDVLWIAPFDLDRAAVKGPARVGLSGFSDVCVDRSGDRVVYAAASRVATRDSIVVVDADGEVVETLVDAAGQCSGLRLSPDGRRLAYTVEADDWSRVWVLDVASGLARPISPERVWDYSARWAPDGRIAFSRWEGSESQELLAMEATPGATPEPLLPVTGEGKVTQDEATFSPDGRYVVCSHWPRDGREPGVYLFEMGDGDHARAFFASQGMEGVAAFSPDGKWVAYNANATGRYEVYLRPFVPENQESAPIYPVTKDGGMNPTWSADGKTLYYRSAGDERATMYAVTVETEPELSISERRTVLTGLKGSPYVEPTRDGRFIREQSASGSESQRPDIRLILNWGLGAEVE